MEGDGPEVMTLTTPGVASLLVPLHTGRPLRARFHWDDHALDLRVRWPQGDDGDPRFQAAFVPAPDPTPPPGRGADPDRVERICECQPLDCTEAYGGTSDACFDAYPSDCEGLLACLRGDPRYAPSCGPDRVLVAATNRCVAPCDGAHTCEVGTCTDYNGGAVCMGASS